MRNSVSEKNEIITSRITLSFFAFAIISLLSWIYILPFKKHYLVINNYYEIIEISAIIITFVLALLSLIRLVICKNHKKDYSLKIFTPQMALMYTVSSFAAAFLIPFSNNRTLTYKYCIVAFFGIFLAYATYYLINKGFILYTAVATIYILSFAFLDYMYSDNVTFSDKISLSYTSFMIILIGLVVVITLISFLVSKKKDFVNINYVALLSLIALAAVIVRIFYISYVSSVTIILETVSYIAICVIEKKGIKFKK